MKNKDKNLKCCGHKMNGQNLFVGLLIGLVILVFGWKIYFQEHPVPNPKMIDQIKIDETLKKLKKEKPSFSGEWSSQGENPAKFTLNEDGTVTGLEGISSWKSDDGTNIIFTKSDESTFSVEIKDGNITIGEIVYKK